MSEWKNDEKSILAFIQDVCHNKSFELDDSVSVEQAIIKFLDKVNRKPGEGKSKSNNEPNKPESKQEKPKTTDEERDRKGSIISIFVSNKDIPIPEGKEIKQGWLLKKGAKRRNWTLRWFILKQGYLIYKKSIKDKGCQGIVHLKKCYVVATESRSKEHCFVIAYNHTHDEETRDYFVSAKNSIEMKSWIDAIAECIIDPIGVQDRSTIGSRNTEMESAEPIKKEDPFISKKDIEKIVDKKNNNDDKFKVTVKKSNTEGGPTNKNLKNSDQKVPQKTTTPQQQEQKVVQKTETPPTNSPQPERKVVQKTETPQKTETVQKTETPQKTNSPQQQDQKVVQKTETPQEKEIQKDNHPPVEHKFVAVGIAIADYEATEVNEITFKTKESIQIIQMNQSDWWKGKNQNGKIGYFPKNFVRVEESKKEKRKAAFDYDANEKNELSFKEGDIITVVEIIPNSEWWKGELNGVCGLFPQTYTENL